MAKEFNLSEKIRIAKWKGEEIHLFEQEDIKEFIKRRKIRINQRYSNQELTMEQRDFLFDDLDDDAGDDLI